MPTGVFNRLIEKTNEHTAIVFASTQKIVETEFVHSECWIFYEVVYEQLRALQGCERLGDLTATANDALNAMVIAKCAGIDSSNISRFNKMKTV